MKRYLLFFSLVFSLPVFSQNITDKDKKVFLDSLWQETAEGNHKYYRIIKDYQFEQDIYKVFDYYKNGVLQMEGSYKGRDLTYKKGEFIYYYENGNKKFKTNSENSKNTGLYYEWYENGNKKTEGEYILKEKSFDNELKINQFWNKESSQLVINGNGLYEEIDEDSFVRGKITEGLKDSIWNGYNKKEEIKFTEVYKKGEFIKGELTYKNNETIYYKTLEEQPRPKKGMGHFVNYLATNLKKRSINDSLTGRILLEFIIEKDGKISDVKVIKGLNPLIDDVAMKTLTNYENWIPGTQRGRNIRVKYNLPLKFDSK
jgi:Gram-negative bacterial TonB protein C-terminal